MAFRAKVAIEMPFCAAEVRSEIGSPMTPPPLVRHSFVRPHRSHRPTTGGIVVDHYYGQADLAFILPVGTAKPYPLQFVLWRQLPAY